MDVQRAAAALPGGHDDLAAVLLQHADRRFVQARERHVGDASRHQGHAVPALPLGGKRAADLAEEEGRIGGWRELFEIAQASQQFEEAHAADQRLHPARLVEVQHGAGNRSSWRAIAAGGRRRSGAPAARPAPRGRCASICARASSTMLPVPHAGGARRFAAAAGQAQVDVLDVGRRDGRAVGHLHHLVDAAARRIHLEAQLAIGRAGVQAKAAVDAAVEIELPRSQVVLFRYGDRVGHGSKVLRVKQVLDLSHDFQIAAGGGPQVERRFPRFRRELDDHFPTPCGRLRPASPLRPRHASKYP